MNIEYVISKGTRNQFSVFNCQSENKSNGNSNVVISNPYVSTSNKRAHQLFTHFSLHRLIYARITFRQNFDNVVAGI